MLLKVLDENQIKILMEEQDVDFYDLPFEKLNYDDPYSRTFIYDLIQRTYEETGIDLSDSRVMIEVIPGVARSYYILISRIKNNGGKQIEFDKAEPVELQEYIYRLSTAEDVVRFFERLKEFYPQNSELYFYKSDYYALLLYNAQTVNNKGLINFLNQLDEFGELCSYRFENLAQLREYGDCIIGYNAADEFNYKSE